MRTIGIAIWIGAAASILFGGYHYWAFLQKLETARVQGKIPNSLLARHLEIGWMIARPGVVPDGDIHRRKAIYGFGASVGLWLIFFVLAALG